MEHFTISWKILPYFEFHGCKIAQKKLAGGNKRLGKSAVLERKSRGIIWQDNWQQVSNMTGYTENISEQQRFLEVKRKTVSTNSGAIAEKSFEYERKQNRLWISRHVQYIMSKIKGICRNLYAQGTRPKEVDTHDLPPGSNALKRGILLQVNIVRFTNASWSAVVQRTSQSFKMYWSKVHVRRIIIIYLFSKTWTPHPPD